MKSGPSNEFPALTQVYATGLANGLVIAPHSTTKFGATLRRSV